MVDVITDSRVVASLSQAIGRFALFLYAMRIPNSSMF